MLNGGPVISELLASNHRNLQDFDDDWSDWIEVANTDSTPVDLGGYYLTDDAGNLDKWSFPAGTVLDGGGQLVVFASKKDYVAPSGELHTNFKLRSEGEFLALVEPDGVTIAAQFDSPLPGGGVGYPAQTEDISYGLTPAGDALQYFAEPTPGAANGIGQLAVASGPEFSMAGGMFIDPFELELTSDVPGGVIHYTLDRTLPTAAAPVYDPAAPIMITNSAQVRAMVVAPDHVDSPVVSRTYVKLAEDVRDFTSPLPIVVLDNFGENYSPTNVFGDRFFQDAYWAVFDTQGADGRSSLVQEPQMTTRVGARTRGQSSAHFDKKPFRLEAWDEQDRDKAVSPLGLPAEADWILNARSTYDRSLMSNALMYALSNAAGRYAVRTRFVELFINADAGELSRDDYYGVYTLMEKVQRGKDRVDVEKLAKNYQTEPLVTGGYMLKIEKLESGTVEFSAGGINVRYEEPSGEEMVEEIRAPQAAYIQNYIDAMAASLTSADPDQGYPAFIDVGSWIDHHLMNVFANNYDGLQKSTFLFKSRGGKLEFGPIWDFDRSLGSSEGVRIGSVGGWPARHFTAPWWETLFEDPDFRQQYLDRYQQLREGAWSDANVETILDDLAAELTAEAADRNFQRWPPGRTLAGDPPSWTGEFNALRTWVLGRLAWLDAALIPKPLVVPDPSSDAGTVPIGTTVTLALPPGAPPGTKIYYTLDGSDPREASQAVPRPDPWDVFTDFHATANGTFVVDLPNGTYDVTLRQGDLVRARDRMAVLLEGVQVDTVDTQPRGYATNTYRVDVADGQLTLSIEDQGGATAAAVLNGLEIAPVAPAAVLAFDFGPSDAAVAAGFEPVADEPFDSGRGYGWTGGTLRLGGVGEPDALRGDFAAIGAGGATFAVEVPNGRYRVTAVMGDSRRGRDQMELRLEPGTAGEVVDVVTTAPGEFHEKSYVVAVVDGRLEVEIEDLGGANGRAVINGLMISPVLQFDFGAGAGPSDTSPLVLALRDRRQYADGVGPDRDADADRDGDVDFDDIDDFLLLATTPGRVEFGYTGVVPSDSYTPAAGYGWSAGAIEALDNGDDLAVGVVSQTAREYLGEPIVITGPTTIHARALLPDSLRRFYLTSQTIDWSGPSQVSLNVTAAQVAITELGYHPAAPSVAESHVDAGFSAGDPRPGEAALAQLGDLDLDGDVDFDDIRDLVLALTDADAYQARHGVSELVSGDLDRSGAIDQQDIALLVARLRQPR